MLNKRPIFVNGFRRGGTNILMNLLLSHPKTAVTTGELQQVICSGARADSKFDLYRKKTFYEWPLSYLLGKSYFSPQNTNVRKLPPKLVRRYLDLILYIEKLMATTTEGHNLYVSPKLKYTRADIKCARVVCKNLNGLVYLTDVFQGRFMANRF